jgi:hypothetical protein
LGWEAVLTPLAGLKQKTLDCSSLSGSETKLINCETAKFSVFLRRKYPLLLAQQRSTIGETYVNNVVDRIRPALWRAMRWNVVRQFRRFLDSPCHFGVSFRHPPVVGYGVTYIHTYLSGMSKIVWSSLLPSLPICYCQEWQCCSFLANETVAPAPSHPVAQLNSRTRISNPAEELSGTAP